MPTYEAITSKGTRYLGIVPTYRRIPEGWEVWSYKTPLGRAVLFLVNHATKKVQSA